MKIVFFIRKFFDYFDRRFFYVVSFDSRSLSVTVELHAYSDSHAYRKALKILRYNNIHIIGTTSVSIEHI